MSQSVSPIAPQVSNTVALVWMNGRILPANEAAVSPFDHGLLVGDGVFETMKGYEGKAFEFDRHCARMTRAAKALQIDFPGNDTILNAVRQTLEANGLTQGLSRIRVTLTGGDAPLGSDKGDATPNLIVAADALPPLPESNSVITVPFCRNEKGALAGLKTTSYGENVVALARAKEAGAHEAIFPNTQGNLCEGTGSNIFIVLDGQLITPPLSSGCLAGVTRAVALELCEELGIDVKEVDVPLSDLARCGEAFLTSTIREIMPISQVDGQAISCPGEVSLKVREAFRKRVA